MLFYSQKEIKMITDEILIKVKEAIIKNEIV